MSVHIRSLKPGDELICYMRTGYAIRKHRRATGEAIYLVPNKPGRARASDMTRFIGWVASNDTSKSILVVQTAFMNSSWEATESSPSIQAHIPYKAFKRVLKYSDYHYPGGQVNPARPTKNDSLGYTQKKPYRTLTEVIL